MLKKDTTRDAAIQTLWQTLSILYIYPWKEGGREKVNLWRNVSDFLCVFSFMFAA